MIGNSKNRRRAEMTFKMTRHYWGVKALLGCIMPVITSLGREARRSGALETIACVVICIILCSNSLDALLLVQYILDLQLG